MRTRIFTALALAALLAGSAQFAAAGDTAPDAEDEIAVQDFRYGHRRHDGRGWRGRHGDWGRGPGHRFGGPGGGFADRPDFDDDFDGPGWRHRGRRGPGMHGMGHGWGMSMGMGFGRWSGIELDQAQKAKLVDVMTANFRARMEAGMALQDARDTLDELRDDKDASAEAIIAANAALGEAKGKLEALRRKAHDDFRGILTEEQVKKLDEKREEMREFREKRREERRDRPGDFRRPPLPGGKGPEGGRPPRPPHGGPGPRR